MSWRPTTIKRVYRAFPTSACTVLVETDAGPGYLKAIGNAEGPHILACELIGSRLARWLGLPTFEFTVIEVTEFDEIAFHDGRLASVGPAFISRAERGEPWGGSDSQLAKLTNAQDVSRLVVFDTWTLNCDRHSWQGQGADRRERINRNNVFLSETGAASGGLVLKAMDHTHCFICGREPSRRLLHVDMIQDPREFGQFAEFTRHLERRQVVKATRDLRRMNSAEAVRLTEGVPHAWGFSGETLEALREFVVRRAQFVADTIAGRLWPQREFLFNEEQEEE